MEPEKFWGTVEIHAWFRVQRFVGLGFRNSRGLGVRVQEFRVYLEAQGTW